MGLLLVANLFALFRHCGFDDLLVLSQRTFDLAVRNRAALHLLLALRFEQVDRLEQLSPRRFLSLVQLVALQGLCNLLFQLLELFLPLVCHRLGHLLEVVLQLTQVL